MIKIKYLEHSDYSAWKSSNQDVVPSNQFDRTELDLSIQYFESLVSRFYQLRENKTSYYFGVFDGDLFVGITSITNIRRDIFQNGYIGIHILNKFWRKKYGENAIKLVCKFADEELRLHRLEAGIEEENLPSILLFEKLGFKYEGLSENRLFIRNKWRNIKIYSRINNDISVPNY